MVDITYLDISAGLGLCAAILLTLNILMGMLLSTAYKRSSYWQKLPAGIRKMNLDEVHKWTGWLVICLVALHPAALLLNPAYQFTVTDILFPLYAPTQAIFVAMGTISFYALLLVLITSLDCIKRSMSFRIWKNIHLISYGTALLFIVHGLLMDPELKNRPVDWLDAEKIVVEVCFFVLTVALFLRAKYHIQKRNSPKSSYRK